MAFLKITTESVNYPFNGRVATNYESGRRFVLMGEGLKYHYQTELVDEFYDLEGDFYEQRNLLEGRSEVAGRMGRYLKATLRRFRGKDYPDGFLIDKTDRKKLKGLGYVN